MSWGVFDSGVGGLTVVRALQAMLPDVPLVYLGDTARVPYGIRSVETVRRYAREAGEFFARESVEGLVVACNTASSLALDAVQDAFGGPALGVVEPGVQEALAATTCRRIGVIGTPATIRSDAYGQRIRALEPSVRVISVACPLFVPLAEEGWTEGEVPQLVARRYLAPLRESAVDTVVLGCTHYPLLAGVIRDVMGPDVALVDSAGAVARAAARLRGAAGAAPATGEAPAKSLRLCVTDAGGSFAVIADRFLGRELPPLKTVRLGPGTAQAPGGAAAVPQRSNP
ncbi:MAG: glutamate racemase [Acidobacteria bacterium]|nr:glutamate racemase [Acidobacteriota bacterium]